MYEYTFGQVFNEFKDRKMKCPHCKKKSKLKARWTEGGGALETEDGIGELWMQVPYYMCKRCKTGVYDVRAHIMESVAVMWCQDEEQTMH